MIKFRICPSYTLEFVFKIKILSTNEKKTAEHSVENCCLHKTTHFSNDCHNQLLPLTANISYNFFFSSVPNEK